MPAPATFAEQVLALPSGGSGVHGLGETFAADPYTGAGRYQVKVPLPAGHNGLAPSLALVYSSGAGNGVCGIGWSFSPGAIRRRTAKGIPRFNAGDTFVYGDDELVSSGHGYFRIRTEGGFERIRHVQAGGRDFWAITDRSGVRRLYGYDAVARDGTRERVTAWQLQRVTNADGLSVEFGYEREEADNRTYLTSVTWGEGAYRLECDYDTRPDTMRSARTGVVEQTSKRLAAIRSQVLHSTTAVFTEFDRLDLGYDTSAATALSRLRTVTRTTTSAASAARVWPALAFAYAEPALSGPVQQVTERPGLGLKGGGLALVDMDGDGLPDLLQDTGSGWNVYRNRGDGGFARPVPVAGPAARLGTSGVFLSDIAGEGFADLVTPEGFYPNRGAGFDPFVAFRWRPSFDLTSPRARFLDLDGDGVGDVLVESGASLTVFFCEPGVGFSSSVTVPRPAGFPRLDDPWVRLADIDGDGLTDVVRVTRSAVEVWSNLGRGQFAEMRRIPLPERLPAEVQAADLVLADVTGTGAADVLVTRPNRLWLFANGCGASFCARTSFPIRAISRETAVEVVDLLGDGVRGILLADAQSWQYHRVFGGVKPDILTAVENGMGASTTISYTSATRHAARDKAAGKTWLYPLPYAVHVVEKVVTTDAVTGTAVTKRFAYHDGYHDAAEREFRGFGCVEQWDAEGDDGSSVVPARVRRVFDVGNGKRNARYFWPTAEDLPKDSVPGESGARRALRGMLVREEVYADDGTLFASRPYLVTHHAYTVKRVVGPTRDSVGSFFPARTSTVALHTERDASDPRIAVTTQSFDAHGRVLESRSVGHGRRGTFTSAHELQQAEDIERWTTTTYVALDAAETDDYAAAYTPTYLVDRPAVVERWGKVASVDTLLGRERHFYDGDEYEGLGYPGSSTTAAVTRGRLSCTLALAFDDALLAAVYDSGWGAASALGARGSYLADGTAHYVHKARFKYDGQGMKVGSLDPRANESTAEYDATHGLFPVGTIDGAGHPTTLTLGDFPFQVATTLDANGNTTSFAWDSSGMVASRAVKGKYVSGAWQGDPDSHPTEVYSYGLATVPVSVTVATRQVRLGATFDVTRYLDGVGRVVQERHSAEPDPATSASRVRVTGAVLYNEKGAVVKAYQPTFDAGASFTTPDTSVPFVETTYDPLGRPARVDYPDGTFETTTWHPWVRQAADRNDNASAITSSDPRYGGILSYFATHLNTPTKTYVDAAGRDIAVAEDLGSSTIHLTRTVLDLRDQPTEVRDARGLSSATWVFATDYLGRRLSADHPTALGARYALPDAADNPIWSRDARGIEVDRTFDALNRPVTESSDDGTATKLRRAWLYVPYDDTDSGFATWQAKNVFGRVEEERDVDGVRWFEYDWRGLVTTVNHRFWPQQDGSARAWTNTASDLWTTGTGWDPAVASTARASVATWLALPDLTDTTTLQITTTYDAAGRPLVSSYPEGTAQRHSYNAAGTLSLLESNDGGGYATVVGAIMYNARGQCTGWTHGNGVVTQRTYDADTERLVSLFTSLPGTFRVDFQDLDYVYDPVGNPSQLTDNLATSSYTAGQIISNTRTFRYDARYRLTRATGKKHNTATNWWDDPVVGSPNPVDYAAYDFTYGYDAAGNLTQNDEFGATSLNYKAARVDLYNGDSGEATSTDPTLGNWRYDASGNCVHTPQHATLGYSFDDQPNYCDKGGGTQVRYFRHGDQRVVRMVQKSGVTALGIYLGPFEYHWRDASTDYTKVVLHAQGPGGRHAQVEAVIAGSDADSLAIFHVHGDHLGSGHVLTNGGAALLSQEEFFAYGRASDRRDARNRYRYIGVERDEDTGLCMTGPRTYMPGIGRFLQGDPLAAKFAGWTPFQYCRGGTVGRSDPSGRADALPETQSGTLQTADGAAVPYTIHTAPPDPLVIETQKVDDDTIKKSLTSAGVPAEKQQAYLDAAQGTRASRRGTTIGPAVSAEVRTGEVTEAAGTYTVPVIGIDISARGPTVTFLGARPETLSPGGSVGEQLGPHEERHAVGIDAYQRKGGMAGVLERGTIATSPEREPEYTVNIPKPDIPSTVSVRAGSREEAGVLLGEKLAKLDTEIGNYLGAAGDAIGILAVHGSAYPGAQNPGNVKSPVWSYVP